jgi:hypothetical protein
VVIRRGSSKLGCLVTTLLVVATAYFGFGVAEVYFRAYRFEDAMKTQARFAGQLPDEVIRKHLRALADSLGLPEEAGAMRIRRTASKFEISAEYHENLELPGMIRTIRFNPSASTTF